jgi:hypothetical protein
MVMVDDAAKLIQRTKYFHEDNKRNTPDWMLEAFKHNKYSKVKEVEKFKERLESSRQLLVVRLEDIFVKLAKEAHSVTATKEAIHDGTANFELPSKGMGVLHSRVSCFCLSLFCFCSITLTVLIYALGAFSR